MIQTQMFSNSLASHNNCMISPKPSTSFPKENEYQTAVRLSRSFEEAILFSKQMQENFSSTGDSMNISDFPLNIVRNIVEVMNHHNVCLFLTLAIRYKSSKLEERCHSYIARHPSAVLSSESFRRCDDDTLLSLFGPNSSISSTLDEILILEALVGWAETRLLSLGAEVDDESVARQLCFVLDSANLPNLKSSLSPRKRSLSNGSPNLEDSPLASGREILTSSSPIIVSFLVGSYELTFDCQNGNFVPLVE